GGADGKEQARAEVGDPGRLLNAQHGGVDDRSRGDEDEAALERRGEVLDLVVAELVIFVGRTRCDDEGVEAEGGGDEVDHRLGGVREEADRARHPPCDELQRHRRERRSDRQEHHLLFDGDAHRRDGTMPRWTEGDHVTPGSQRTAPRRGATRLASIAMLFGMRRHPHRRWPQRLRALLLVSSLSALAFWPVPSAEGDARTVREGHSARMPRLNEWLGFFRPVGEAYELDDIARYIEPRARLTCPSEAIVPYRGEHLRYARSAHVHRAFLPRLEKLEALVVEVATDIYGRAPRRLVHRGAYNCRHLRGRPERLSQHARGNALDLSGFDLGPLRRGDALAEGVPSHLRRSFTVRVDRHWSPSRERD